MFTRRTGRVRPLLSGGFGPWVTGAALTLASLAHPQAARADEPLSLFFDFSGNADFFATGAAMAVNESGGDNNVDALVHPATTMVTQDDIPEGAILRNAFLYWGGSIPDGNDCADAEIDNVVTFTPPGEATSAVVADNCYCSAGGAQSYDIQVCRAQVTNLLGDLVGSYDVDDFSALIANQSTNNASFSIVLIYTAPSLPTRHIALYDGLLTMWDQLMPQEVVLLSQIEIDNPADGDLTWYVLEGDTGGAGAESVSVRGVPGNQTQDLLGPINPIDNPMNHTINTTTPPQTDSFGVDIDQFSINEALTPGDSSVLTTYSAGGDKYWIAYNIVGVNIFSPNFSQNSEKTWVLHDDADDSMDPSPGDTIRYTIHLQNDGDVAGTLVLTDPMPVQVASWAPAGPFPGTDNSTEDTLSLADIELNPGESAEVVFDVVIALGTEGQNMFNVASYVAPPNGSLEAPPVPISGGGNPGDGDGDPSGDGDGDPAGDGDGDLTGDGDGDGDPGTTSGASGSDSDTGTGMSSGDTDPAETGFSGGFGQETDNGCNCSSGNAGPAGLGLFLLGLLTLRRRET